MFIVLGILSALGAIAMFAVFAGTGFSNFLYLIPAISLLFISILFGKLASMDSRIVELKKILDRHEEEIHQLKYARAIESQRENKRPTKNDGQ